MHVIVYAIFAILVAGIHVGLGLPMFFFATNILEPLYKKTRNDFVGFLYTLLGLAGGLLTLYGIFVWLSCWGAGIILLIASLW